jgi:hypothetical protein
MAVAAGATRWLRRRLEADRDQDGTAALGSLDSLRAASIPCAGLAALFVLWSTQGWLAGQVGAVLQHSLIAAVAVILGIAMLRAWERSGTGLLRPEVGRMLTWSCIALILLAVVVSMVKEAALRQPLPPPALFTAIATMCGGAAFLLLAP